MPDLDEDAEDAVERAVSRSLWRNRDYMAWWLGNGVSTLGTSVSAVAYPLLVLRLTGSATQAGTVSAFTMIGTLATLVVSGALADRVSRRAIMIVAPLVQGVSMTGVVLMTRLGEPPLVALDAIGLLCGLAAGMFSGVAMPVLRRVVPRELVPTATAQGMGRDMLARLGGAPLGGALFAAARWLPFLFDALSFLFVPLSVLLIRRPLGPDRVPGAARTSLAEDIREGLRLVRNSGYLSYTIVWGALLNMVTQGFTLLFVVLVRYRGGGPTMVGAVSSLALTGGFCGALFGPALLRRMSARRVVHLSAWLVVTSFSVVAWVPRPWQIGLALMVAMFSVVPLNMVFDSYQVRIVPDTHLGRVAAANRFGVQALQWGGPLLFGWLADRAGVVNAVRIATLAVAALAVALHVSRRRLAVLDSPLAEAKELTPAIAATTAK